MKLKVLDNNYPCECGHEKKVHWYLGGACSSVTLPFAKELRKECLCMKFIPDNLRYLEKKQGQKDYDKYKFWRTKAKGD